jgi:regulator of replication initiation timing
MRSSVVFKRLPEMYTELNDLKKQIEELKAQLSK